MANKDLRLEPHMINTSKELNGAWWHEESDGMHIYPNTGSYVVIEWSSIRAA